MEGDFLKMDLRTLFPEGLRVIGNFPYNISSQIFFKVLKTGLDSGMRRMIQKRSPCVWRSLPARKEYGI